MPNFDEATIRKAAAWQDFKEAQLLLNVGAVLESESSKDGWSGAVKAGKRTYRVTVVARTPTWLDAKCSCPGNQRDGSFCPHAIATGLHLCNPPAPIAPPPPPKEKAENLLPALAWKIRFQGPWEKSLSKSHLAVAVAPDGVRPPEPADDRLTQWMLAQGLKSKADLQLALSLKTLHGFLDAIRNHPQVSGQDQAIHIDAGTQLQLADCYLEDEVIHLLPDEKSGLLLGDKYWRIDAESLSSSSTIPRSLLPIFEKLAAAQTARIPLKVFLGQIETLQKLIDFSASEWFSTLQIIPSAPQFKLSLKGTASRIKTNFSHSYPQESLPELAGNTLFTRDLQKEKSAQNVFRTIVGENEITHPGAIQTLLTRTLKSLPEDWSVTLDHVIERISSSYVFISPRIQIRESNDAQTEFELLFETDEGAPIPSSEVRRLLSSKGSSASSPSKQYILSEDIEGLLDPLLENLDVRQENGRFITSQASTEVIKEISKNFRNGLVISDSEQKNINEIPIPLPPISAELRPYQVAGYRWLADRLKRYHGALLADDMGLGKTLQTIVLIEHLMKSNPEQKPTLIVVTTSLLGNWKAEFSRFAPERNVIILHGAKRDSLRDPIGSGDVILTTYATLARDLAYHLRQEYSIAVIDEASLIRNPDTDHAKAVARLNAVNRIALTGTPIENSASDLWSIFRFIQPGWMGTRKQFEDKYERPLKAPDTALRASQLLRLKTSPFVLRRTKQEVAPELPSKIQIDEFCTLSKEQFATYRELQTEGQRKASEIQNSGQTAAARMQTLVTLLRLRQACCDLALFDSEKLKALPIPRRSAKLERLMEIAEQAIQAGSKILVFSQFQKQLVEIETVLQAAGISSLRLDGGTRNRQDLVDQFQSEDGPPIFLISLKAGGYGLNLTAADIVIHFDPWWNPAAEAQATDRAHRIGQTKPVTVFRLLTRNTVEEKVLRLQSTKKALAQSLDESSIPSDAPAWSAAELERLLHD